MNNNEREQAIKKLLDVAIKLANMYNDATKEVWRLKLEIIKLEILRDKEVK